MRPFNWGDNVPAYVVKCRDTGERHHVFYVGPEGLTVTPEGIPYDQPSVTAYVQHPKDGAGRLVVVVAVRCSTRSETLWFYGTAGGYGYDKLSAAGSMPEQTFHAGSNRWTLADHGDQIPDGVVRIPLRDVVNRSIIRLPNGGAFIHP